MAAPLMQYRSPVGRGPSSKTCPRCPPHRRQCTSMRRMPKLVSSVVPIALSRGRQKLGHPVPLSYLASDENKGRPQPAQANTPARFSPFSGLV